MVQDFINEHRQKLLRYAGVSVVGVVSGQSLLFAFYEVIGWSAVFANLMAVVLATIPSYLLNRAWVWQRVGGHSLASEILPFWAMALLGLALSTVLVHFAEQRWDSWVIINAANLAAFGVLWLAKFIILERFLFAERVESVIEAPAAR